MIPIRLNLSNFLAYRSPNPIVFDGIHLACLIGENGAGKSSLLDAITWAIWGKSRSRHDNDLIHMGANRMVVELDFEHEGQTYRITRSRERRGSSGVGQLRLDIYDDNDQLVEINEPNKNATQARINSLLRLDYDTFVNSAFLKQGEANAFTVKRPAERKQVLSNILGLSDWSVYENTVKEKLNSLQEQLNGFNVRIEEIDKDLQTEPQRQRDLADAQAKRDSIKQELDLAEELLRQVENAPNQLKATEERLDTEQRRLNEYQNSLQDAQRAVEEHTREIDTFQQVIDQREDIEQGYQALQNARNANDELNKLYRQYTGLTSKINKLKASLDQEETRLSTELESVEKRIATLDEQIAAVSDADLAALREQVQALEAKQAEREALNQQIAGLNTDHANLEGNNQSLYISMNELKERIDALGQVDGATCPLCGQPLTEEHRAELLAELQEQGTQQGDTYRENLARMDAIHDEREAARQQVNALAVEVQTLPKLQTELGKQANQAEAAQADTAERAACQQRRDDIRAALADQTFGAGLRDQIATVAAQRDALGYDEDAHNSYDETLKQYHDYEERHTRLAIAAASLPQRVEMRDTRQQQADELQEKIQAQDVLIVDLEEQLKQQKDLVETYEAHNKEAMDLRTKVSNASERIGQAQQALRALEQQRKTRKDYEDRRAIAAKQQATYKELRIAFGKNGVPAMIIEAAIPELEATTNDLLGRMTDGRMMVRFNMLREKVTGGLAETLDIEIADELGTRSYDMYSGGEAFRINFAIRVAISKMLARRAGAHLEVLFIDEGFGTQDADGRNKLVEAINAIKDDFDLMLVITHIDELKDAFPVHIHVAKTPQGSQVEIR
jgi:DNA repair protein SbcC/Rad50